MSTRTASQPKPEGLSITTLLIASASSVAAAIFIHKFWKGGAILGAGITPIIVAITSEALKRPTRAITAIRSERRDRSTVARGTPGEVPVAPPPELERADPFGIWEADQPRRSWWDRIKGRPLKIALATGVLAFAVGAIAVTGTQLVFGDGDGGDRLIYVPGKQKKSASDDETKTTTTETTTTETAPADEDDTQTAPQTTPTVPQTTPTTPTTPTVPQTTTTPPPATTTPAPGVETQPATPPAG